MKRKTIAATALVCGALSFAACGGTTATTPSTTTITVAGTSALTVGQTAQLSASEVTAGGTAVDVTTKSIWSSSDTTIATVSAGVVTGVAAGTATVSAEFDGVTGSVSVTISAVTKTGTETYSYVGAPLTVFNSGAFCPPVCQITGSFTVDNPLSVSQPSLSPQIRKFSFTDGNITITQANATFSNIIVSTDANGQIVLPWVIEVQTLTPAGLVTLWSVNEATTNAGDSSVVDGGGANARNAFSPGVWSVSP